MRLRGSKMTKIKIKKKDISKILFWICVLFSIVRICVNFKMAYLIRPDFGSDDGLLFNYADSLAKFNWLGEYNCQTLVKGMSYSLLLAFCAKTSIPYSVVLSGLDILAALTFVLAIKEKIKSDYILKIVYILLLFNPISLDYLARQRMYRNSLIPDMTVIVFSCMIGVFFRRNKSFKELLGWNLATGAVLCYFYYLREDSIWVMPFVLVVTILNLIDTFLINGKKELDIKGKIKKTVLFLLPLIMLVCCTFTIKIINKKYYGVFLVNDRTGGYFADAMSDLYRIDGKKENKSVWISKDAINTALKNSSTLRTIKKEVNESIKTWGGGKEVKGDLITWSLRQAAENKGLYKDANTANDFWKKVHIELKAARKDGKIKTKKGIFFTKQATGVKYNELPKYMMLSVENMNKISSYSECKMQGELPLYPNPAKIRYYEVRYGVYAPLELNEEDTKMVQSKKLAIVSNRVIKMYKKTSKIINLVVVLSYIMITICVLYQLIKKKYDNLECWLMITGIALSAYCLIFGVSFFTSWFTKDMEVYIRPFYSSGAYGLIQIGKYLCILSAVELAAKAFKNLKNKKK